MPTLFVVLVVVPLVVHCARAWPALRIVMNEANDARARPRRMDFFIFKFMFCFPPCTLSVRHVAARHAHGRAAVRARSGGGFVNARAADADVSLRPRGSSSPAPTTGRARQPPGRHGPSSVAERHLNYAARAPIAYAVLRATDFFYESEAERFRRRM